MSRLPESGLVCQGKRGEGREEKSSGGGWWREGPSAGCERGHRKSCSVPCRSALSALLPLPVLRHRPLHHTSHAPHHPAPIFNWPGARFPLAPCSPRNEADGQESQPASQPARPDKIDQGKRRHSPFCARTHAPPPPAFSTVRPPPVRQHAPESSGHHGKNGNARTRAHLPLLLPELTLFLSSAHFFFSSDTPILLSLIHI